MCGIGVIVIFTQINAFVGLETAKSIYGTIKNFGNTIQNINIEALYVSIPCLLILLLWVPIEKKVKTLTNPIITHESMKKNFSMSQRRN